MNERTERDEKPTTKGDEIDTASADSFPASDPPTWSRGQAEDPAMVNPETFQRERREEEHGTYGSGEHHDGR